MSSASGAIVRAIHVHGIWVEVFGVIKLPSEPVNFRHGVHA